MQAGSPQQLLSFSAPLSFFIYSLIHCANVKCWFCARPCAGAFAMFSYNVRDREDNWAEGEGVAVNSGVCGGHGAGAGTESWRQADRYRALIMSPSCLAQNSPTQQQTSHPAGTSFHPTRHPFSAELLPVFPVHLGHFGHPGRTTFSSARALDVSGKAPSIGWAHLSQCC